MVYRNTLGALADDSDAVSTLVAGQHCVRRGLRLSVRAHNTEPPERRAATYEQAQYEFQFAAWAAGRLASLLHTAGELDRADCLATAERCCTHWASQTRTAHEHAATQPIGLLPTQASTQRARRDIRHGTYE